MATAGPCSAPRSSGLLAAPEQVQLMEEAADTELEAPAQKRMAEAPEHGAWFSPLSGGGAISKPDGSDSLLTKVVCLSCGIGEPLGNWVIGNAYQCFCIKGQEYCGLGGGDGCPAADAGCDMFKPHGDCSASCKILFCKFGIDCPERPWLVCNGNTVFN